MTELTREQIEKMREDAIYQSPLITGNVVELCNMALAKKDAEAECERLRSWLARIRDERKEEGACYGALAGAQKAFARQALEGKPYTPEQAHGDALAALKRVRSMIEECEVGDTEFGDNEENREVTARLNDIDYAIEPLVRRHLTASGVPYVPESIRDLPEKMRREANYVEPDRFRPADSYSMGVDDMANMLEAALAATLNDGGGA